jgi:tripartite motif-containing protein 39
VKALKLNFDLRDLVQQHILEKEKKLTCENCTENIAIYRCKQCMILYCNQCYDDMHKRGVFQKHEKGAIGTTPKIPKCKKHERELDLFCKKDNSTVCYLCTMSEHKNHDVIPVVDHIEAYRSDLLQNLSKLEQRSRKLKERKERVTQVKQNIHRHQQDYRKSLDFIHEKLRTVLDKSFKEMKDRSLQEEGEQSTLLESQETLLMDSISKFNITEESIRKASQTNNIVLLSQSKNNINILLNQIDMDKIINSSIDSKPIVIDKDSVDNIFYQVSVPLLIS